VCARLWETNCFDHAFPACECRLLLVKTRVPLNEPALHMHGGENQATLTGLGDVPTM
jgi:hypothetical protein